MAKGNTEESNKFGWFLAGALVGTAVGMLYAPKTGQQTRDFIGASSKEGRAAVETTGRDLVEKGKDLYDRGRRIAEDAADLFDRGRKLVQGGGGSVEPVG